MEESHKWLSALATILFTVLLISIGFYAVFSAYNVYKHSSYEARQDLNNVVSAEWQSYANKIVNGSNVRYLEEQYGNDAFIRVVTNECPFGFFMVNDVSDKTSQHFIDSADSFYCSPIYADEVLVGLQCSELHAPNLQNNSDYTEKVNYYNKVSDYVNDTFIPLLKDEYTILSKKPKVSNGTDSIYSLFVQEYIADKEDQLFKDLLDPAKLQ